MQFCAFIFYLFYGRNMKKFSIDIKKIFAEIKTYFLQIHWKIIPILIFESFAFLQFTSIYCPNEYKNPQDFISQVFGLTYLVQGEKLFLLNFFGFFAIHFVFLIISTVCRRGTNKVFCLLASQICAILALYSIADLFTVKLPVYFAWIFAAAVVFKGKKNLGAMICGAAVFLIFQFHYSFMGADLYVFVKLDPSPQEFAAACLILGCYITFLFLLSRSHQKYRTVRGELAQIAQRLDETGFFITELQESNAKSAEEAAEEERLRITREIHDSTGYVLVNIIAMMDAIMSCGCQNQSEELFESIRKQASDGLQETRRILRQLRAPEEEPKVTTIEAAYKLKQMLESVSAIKVEIEAGNMQKDYGEKITKVLTRIIQESFTNSIKHGHSSRILIHFWQRQNELTMTITDNGKGAKQIVKGIGLSGMEERLARIGGSLSAAAMEEGGFRICAKVPLTGEEEN